MRLRARSSRPKQQNSRAKPLRLRGVRPFSAFPSELDDRLELVGERGIVAFAKMDASGLRVRGSMKTCLDGISRGVPYGEGVYELCFSDGEFMLIDVSMG